MSYNPTPPQTNDTAAAGAAAGGVTGTTAPGVTYDTPPGGQSDDQLAQWLQDKINAIDASLINLEQDYDNAVILFDNAQAALAAAQQDDDPLALDVATRAVAAARSRAQLAQRRAEQARVAQNRYLQQQNKVLDRQQKAAARDDPNAAAVLEQRKAELDAQITQNTAELDLARKRLDLEEKKLLAENDPARVAAEQAVRDAQIARDTAATTLATAQAAAYPAESAASVGASSASAAANQAQAAQINALIAAGMPEAQARLVVAQEAAQRSATDVNAEDLRQKQLGEIGVLAEQLQRQVDAGALTREQARGILQGAVDKATTGATPYERQNQTAANSLAFARDAMQQGALVRMDQEYAPGQQPGGFYDQASQQLGFGSTGGTRLNPTPLPRAVASLGADVSQPYNANQLGVPPPGAQGVQQTAAGPPQAVQSLGSAQVNWSALTGPQVEALLRSGQHVTPQAPPVTSVPVLHGGGSVPGPMGV